MTERTPHRLDSRSSTLDQDLSWMMVVRLVADRLTLIVSLALLGGALAAILSLTSPRRFVSVASFVPESSGASGLGLAAAARQFGLGVGDASGGTWTSALYVQVLSSDGLLVSLASDTVDIAEQAGRRLALVDVFDIEPGDSNLRAEHLVRFLRREVLSVSESRLVGSVTIRVTTRWPSVSESIAKALVRRVDEFNQMARQEQAAAELSFLDARMTDAETALRGAEHALEVFLSSNRVAAVPQLEFRRDRLQRDVRFHEQMVLGLAERREDARLRRIKDTPSVTIIERARRPAIGQPRGTAFRAVLGAMLGALLALAWGVWVLLLQRARLADPEEFAVVAARLKSLLPRKLRRARVADSTGESQ